MTLDERFGRFSESVSEKAGYWQHTTFWLVVFIAWCMAGPFLHFSDSWQLWGNTPTTWVELFLGLLILNAANRSEGRIEAMAVQIKELAESIKADVDEVKQDIEH